ncbi:MAG: glycosyltransferase family 4 protein [Treponema sp.]|nr:glycosyltransferase family 4 protein [Treponema sp.]
MKIGIDTFGCEHGQSGQGTYLKSLISNLPQHSDLLSSASIKINSKLEYELFGSEIDKYTFTCGKDIPYVSVNIPDNLKAQRFWHIRRSKKFTKKNGYDVVIYPAADKMLPKNFKTDAVAIITGVLSDSLNKMTKREARRIKKGLSRVNKIIASSAYIKSDLVKNGFSSKKIEVIKVGIDHKLFFPSLQNDNDVVEIQPFAIMRPYFIFASRLSDYDKKHIELIKAFNLFKKRTGYPHRLVISGSPGPKAEEIQTFVFNSEYASDILLTGYFPHESFPQLYSGATACVFPPVNEGIGLPVLEAMACGIPVLCSDSGALKEIGSSVPLYFNSDNIEEIADCLQKIVENQEIFAQKAEEGLQWSKKYNLEDSVQKTIDSVISIKLPKKSKKEKQAERQKKIHQKTMENKKNKKNNKK